MCELEWRRRPRAGAVRAPKQRESPSRSTRQCAPMTRPLETRAGARSRPRSGRMSLHGAVALPAGHAAPDGATVRMRPAVTTADNLDGPQRSRGAEGCGTLSGCGSSTGERPLRRGSVSALCKHAHTRTRAHSHSGARSFGSVALQWGTSRVGTHVCECGHASERNLKGRPCRVRIRYPICKKGHVQVCPRARPTSTPQRACAQAGPGLQAPSQAGALSVLVSRSACR